MMKRNEEKNDDYDDRWVTTKVSHSWGWFKCWWALIVASKFSARRWPVFSVTSLGVHSANIVILFRLFLSSNCNFISKSWSSFLYSLFISSFFLRITKWKSLFSKKATLIHVDLSKLLLNPSTLESFSSITTTHFIWTFENPLHCVALAPEAAKNAGSSIDHSMQIVLN